MEKRKSEFLSIRTKVNFYMASMIFTCVASLLAILVLNQIYSRRLLDILHTHEYFSIYYTKLDEIDGALYRFSSSDDSKKEDLYQECLSYTEEIMETADILRDMAGDPVVEDFYYLADTYTTSVRDILERFKEENSSAETSEAYQETVKIKNMIRNGYTRLWTAVDTYCDNRTAAVRNWQGKAFALVFTSVILCIAFCTAYNLGFFKILIRTILSLTATVKSEITLIKSGENGVSQRLPAEKMANDETMILALSLYQMLDDEKKRIELIQENEALMKQLQQEQLQEMHIKSQLHRARLQQIQSLVNPHFLFNTLAVISDLSIRENAPETQDAIEKLSIFFRYSLAYLSSTVTVTQEIASLRNYFDIQRLRFKGRYHFEIDLEPGCEEYRIPAIVLQPLAENALHHGVGSYDQGGKVWCRIFREQGDLKLEMTDNGVGMTKEQVNACYQKINQGLEGDISAHIGLMLVFYRLQDFTGGRCHFLIESLPGRGTKIQFFFPLQVYEELRQ